MENKNSIKEVTLEETLVSKSEIFKTKTAETYFEQAAKNILEGLSSLGFPVEEDHNFNETVERYKKACLEIFSGSVNTDSQIKNILSKSFRTTNFDQVIIARNIVVYGICPHHLLPVKYVISVGYLPGETMEVLGVSKLVRLVKVLAKRPVLQEQLSGDIVEYLEKIKPRGVGVVVKAEHLCMQMRGVEQQGDIITSKLTGCFLEGTTAKLEFLQLLKGE